MNPIDELKQRLENLKAVGVFAAAPLKLSEDAVRLAGVYRRLAITWDTSGASNTEEFLDEEARDMLARLRGLEL